MKNSLILMTISLMIYGCNSNRPLTKIQIIKKNYQEVVGDAIEADKKPDKYAMYPSGLKGIYEHISKNIKYPSEARQAAIEGKVIVSYFVETNGTVKETKIIQSIHHALDKEAIRIVLTMDRWVPGYKDKKPVRIKYIQPFNFKLK